eukprot:CAMPEP_0202061704 /NCGR_PEP_ID=MMETSP0963-20130614/41895_1 /ASSEMBLY_ACC=CAM_ASM_000494 /TAXON_ID=4773 /ORGANISM="Schizochytrium aggregatum, Strain ATCC28209" /LENGTH=145 /DNA_ID=CAMNT_0048627943 /DNA_START=224 /DNA_END=658 /DNA_ORIENTATION=+
MSSFSLLDEPDLFIEFIIVWAFAILVMAAASISEEIISQDKVQQPTLFEWLAVPFSALLVLGLLIWAEYFLRTTGPETRRTTEAQELGREVEKVLNESMFNAQANRRASEMASSIKKRLGGTLVKVADVPGDGRCFFHALAHELN